MLTIKSMYALTRAVKQEIDDDCRAFEGDIVPGIQLTVGYNDKTGDWSYQTGDNSFMGSAYHYPHWAVIGVYRTSNCRELARDIINQIEELIYQ